MRTHNIPLCYRKSNRPLLCRLPGAFINPHWLELPLSRTNFHGPKGVRAIEVRLYLDDMSIMSIIQHYRDSMLSCPRHEDMTHTTTHSQNLFPNRPVVSTAVYYATRPMFYVCTDLVRSRIHDTIATQQTHSVYLTSHL